MPAHLSISRETDYCWTASQNTLYLMSLFLLTLEVAFLALILTMPKQNGTSTWAAWSFLHLSSLIEYHGVFESCYIIIHAAVCRFLQKQHILYSNSEIRVMCSD